MRLKLIFIICLFGTLHPISTKGQNKSESSEQIINLGFSLNFSTTKFLNKSFINDLKEQNLPIALDNAAFGLNSNIYLSHLTPDTKLIAIIGLGAATQKKTDSNITLNASAINNDYSIHYVVLKKARQYFYPGVGFGWMNYKYHFVNKTVAPLTFPQALQNFSGERNIQSGGLTYLNFAANYDWAIDKSNEFLLGIRANYHLGLNHKNLQLNDGQGLSQSPELKASSFSIGIALTVQ